MWLYYPLLQMTRYTRALASGHQADHTQLQCSRLAWGTTELVIVVLESLYIYLHTAKCGKLRYYRKPDDPTVIKTHQTHS